MNPRKHHLDLFPMNSKAFKRHAPNMSFPNAHQFHESCLPQEFSFPKPIMKYIWENPSSSKAYQKLIQCCKFFFLKNPILVLKNLECRLQEWSYCNANDCDGHVHKKFEIDKYNCQIWVTNCFEVITGDYCNIAADIIPKIYRNDGRILKLINQILSFDQLKFLVPAGVEECRYGNNIVKYDNGEQVVIDEVIKLFSGAKEVSIFFSRNTFNSVCKNYANLIEACSAIKKVNFPSVPAVFNIREFYQQLKHSKSHVLFHISSWLLGAVIDEIVDEILATESFDFVPPVCRYEIQDETTLKKMVKIQAREAAKYH